MRHLQPAQRWAGCSRKWASFSQRERQGRCYLLGIPCSTLRSALGRTMLDRLSKASLRHAWESLCLKVPILEQGFSSQSIYETFFKCNFYCKSRLLSGLRFCSWWFLIQGKHLSARFVKHRLVICKNKASCSGVAYQRHRRTDSNEHRRVWAELVT